MLDASLDFNKQRLGFLRLQHDAVMKYWAEKQRLLGLEERYLEIEHAAKMATLTKDKEGNK